jgi:NADPH-dependent ferric siderophore reductase
VPELPAPVAGRAERWFARPASVVGVDRPAARLRRVRFAGDALRDRRWTPGQEVEFRVGPREFRHYTPAAFDTGAGELEILFHLHGNGPGSAWAAGLRPGDEVGVMGPGGRFTVRAAPAAVLCGDETSLGLFRALAGALPAGARLTGAVEVGPDLVPAARDLLPAALAVLPRDAGRGDALAGWLPASRPGPGAVAYLAGHAGTVRRLRALLLEAGLDRRAVRAKAYWADGRRGL